MKCSYRFKETDTYLEMEITGPYDYWEFINFPEIIRRKCKALQTFKIIVDVIEVTYVELPILELFFLGEKLAEKLRDRIKIALLWHGDTRDYFLQNVAANRAASIRIFHTPEDAMDWLLFDHEDEPFNFKNS